MRDDEFTCVKPSQRAWETRFADSRGGVRGDSSALGKLPRLHFANYGSMWFWVIYGVDWILFFSKSRISSSIFYQRFFSPAKLVGGEEKIYGVFACRWTIIEVTLFMDPRVVIPGRWKKKLNKSEACGRRVGSALYSPATCSPPVFINKISLHFFFRSRLFLTFFRRFL